MNMEKALAWWRKPLFWLVAAVVITVEAATGFGFFVRPETGWSDWRLRLAGVRHWPRHVALVVIDDASLNQYKDDPLAFWTPQMAKAAQRLREIGASVVGIDFLFSVSPEAWLSRLLPASSKIGRTYDAPLRAEINSGQVVLVSSQLPDAQTGYDQLLLPDRSFLMAVPDFDFAGYVALANLTPDSDGVVRHFNIAPQINLPASVDRAVLPRFTLAPLLAAHAAGIDRESDTWNIAGLIRRTADQVRPIVYSGPPGTVPRVALSRLLAESAARDPVLQDLRGKVVIIGGEFMSMGDMHLTPYGTGWFSGEGSIMTGAELQANIVETLLAGLEYRPFPAPARVALVLLFAAVGAGLWSARGALRVGGLVAALGLAALVSFYAFVDMRLLEATPLAAALLLAFGSQAVLAHSPRHRHLAYLHKALGTHVGENDIAWLAASRHTLSDGWETYPAAVLALILPPQATAADPVVFARRLEELRKCLWALGATTSTGEGQTLLAYFGWPRPSVNPCREALAAVPVLLALLREHGVAERAGIGVHVGETAFLLKRGSIMVTGESVAAAIGLGHLAMQTGSHALVSCKVFQAASPDEASVVVAAVWNSGDQYVEAGKVDERSLA